MTLDGLALVGVPAPGAVPLLAQEEAEEVGQDEGGSAEDEGHTAVASEQQVQTSSVLRKANIYVYVIVVSYLDM